MDEPIDDFFDFDGDGHLSCLELAFVFDLIFGMDDSSRENESDDEHATY